MKYARVLLAFIVGLSGASCGECPSRGYDEGERFNVTVLDHTEDSPADCELVEIGASFVLTAGPAMDQFCDDTGAIGAGPPFAPPDVYPNCRQISSQLGMECDSTGPAACGPSVHFSLGPRITRKDRVIENGTMGVIWTFPDPVCSQCREGFAVRIEALDRQ